MLGLGVGPEADQAGDDASIVAFLGARGLDDRRGQRTGRGGEAGVDEGERRQADMNRALFCAEQAVASVAEAGDDVTLLVQPLGDPEGTFPSPLSRQSREIHPTARRVARPFHGRFVADLTRRLGRFHRVSSSRSSVAARGSDQCKNVLR